MWYNFNMDGNTGDVYEKSGDMSPLLRKEKGMSELMNAKSRCYMNEPQYQSYRKK